MLPEELLAKASGSFQLQSAFLMYPYDPYVVKKWNNGFEKNDCSFEITLLPIIKSYPLLILSDSVVSKKRMPGNSIST